ncbi:MAG: hypothetical protein ABSA76_12610, partial [Bacteroidales bacterium]
ESPDQNDWYNKRNESEGGPRNEESPDQNDWYNKRNESEGGPRNEESPTFRTKYGSTKRFKVPRTAELGIYPDTSGMIKRMCIKSSWRGGGGLRKAN